ncbi:alpha/beta fold hydrolase [Gordonia sp. NPDC003376]
MTRIGPTRTLVRAALIGGPVLVGAAAVARFAATNLCTFRRDWRSVLAAGYTEKQVVVDGVVINYGEGPARGKPPLLLIHGQASDWKSYAPVLPDLAAMFHVYAVDVPGHGGSDRIADGYTAIGIGALLKRFVDDVIGEPVVLSGHSSGGQLAAWLAANAPDDVTAVLLEDPPMFTTLLPRAEKTWNWVDLATCCHSFRAADDTDFVRYYWTHQYMWKYFGGGADRIRRLGTRSRDRHPDRPLALWWWPVNNLLRSMQTYDPVFGDAFYTDAWDEGFDHESTLKAVVQQTIYVHTAVDFDGDILRGAASDEDAARIVHLLPNARLVQADTGHGFHDEDPAHFVSLLDELRR